jgi:hypothetical protein
MTPENCFTRIVEPTLQWMAASPSIGIPVTDAARVLVMTIAGQESRWEDRRQIGIGEYYPQKIGARGFWQFESPWFGPVALVDVLLSTPIQIGAVCKYLDIPVDKVSLYEACAWNDMLACAMARLLLWRDPARLPAVGDKEGAWVYYVRNWKPGAPHHDSWSGLYDQSIAAIGRRTP